tara:strand:+ start:28 stop:1311 length:1284 start_codon:yes stop_codon:yes gene_type:complete
MSDFQKYKPEFIFKFKNEVVLTDKIKKKLLSIAKNMKSSTDSKSFKVKISEDINLNANKWHRKRFMSENEKIKKKINSNLNMYSKLNYEKTIDNIMKLKLNSEDQVDFLLTSIIEKYRFDHNSNVWNYLLKKIVFSNVYKWRFKNKFISEKILDIVQTEFDDLNINYQKNLDNYFSCNTEEFYRIKNKNYGLMKLITELYSYKLIKKDIITYILENLTLDINKNYKLELGIVLVESLFKYLSLNERNKFIDYFKIYLNNDSLNKKVKFMIQDFLEDKKEHNVEIKVDNYISDDQIDACIKSNINEYKDDENLEDFILNIKSMKVPIKSNKMIYYWIIYMLENDDDFDTAMLLLSSCIYKKIIKYNTLKYGLIEFLNDYDDYKWDYPNIDKILKKVIKGCKKNGFLTYDNLKFIFNKINISDLKSKLM